MSNVLSEDKKHQVIALGRLGWSLRRIEEATGVRRETASEHLKAAGVPVRGRGGRPRVWPPKPATTPEVSTDSGGSNPAISDEVSTDSDRTKPATRAEVSTDPAAVPRPGRAPGASACEPYRELIERALERGRNAMAIWQDLVDAHGFSARYSSVRRFVQAVRGTAPQPHAVITTAPGEESQVDYGDGPMVRHPVSGKYRRTRLFVLTLGYSRKSIRLLVWQSSAQIWAELHERAFRRLGGSTRIVVLDNLKEGVLTPDIYDPALNPLYRDVLAHYGIIGLPCRVGDPDRNRRQLEPPVALAQRPQSDSLLGSGRAASPEPPPERLNRVNVSGPQSGPQLLIFSPVRFNLTGMRETLTVSLPPRTKRLIARAATESGLTTSEYVRMAIHRKLWQDAVAEARRVAVPRARAKGIFTDEDVFALIS